MSALAGRRVVLGVSGGIAAYKAIEVCRRLVDAGAHVVPVLTSGAQHFVGFEQMVQVGLAEILAGIAIADVIEWRKIKLVLLVADVDTPIVGV